MVNLNVRYIRFDSETENFRWPASANYMYMTSIWKPGITFFELYFLGGTGLNIK